MSSRLNPEAQEFKPEFDLTGYLEEEKQYNVLRGQCNNAFGMLMGLLRYCSVSGMFKDARVLPVRFKLAVENGFLMMNKTIRLSNNLPVGAAYKQYRSVSDFDVVTQKFSHYVFVQLNRIFVTELSSVRLKEGDSEFNMERLIDANDSILDRTYVNIECVNKGVEPKQQSERKMVGPGGYHNPIVTTIQVGSATFTGAKNIPRPQLYFKEPVDNTRNIFEPKIVYKPNNIRPLALELNYNDAGEAIGYVHPYQMELMQFSPKLEWITPDEAPLFPSPLKYTKFIFIETEEQMNSLVTHLNRVDVIGVDLEHHSYRSYQGFTCLIQLTTHEGDFIIDALAVREHVHKLNEPFTNPRILKIFHGAEMDIQWLQRDFSVYVVGMFDTHKAAIVLNQPSRSLAALLKRYCRLDVDKRYQLADWRLRPLTNDMITYARTDTHYLIYIWLRMRNELWLADNCNREKLLTVFEQSRNVCLMTYTKPVITEKSHMDLYFRNKKTFNSQQMEALRMFFQWRDGQARTLDESTMYLLPNHMLLALAELLPNDEQGIAAICNPMPPFVKQNISTILRMILSCREVTVQPQINPTGNEHLWSLEPTPDIQTYHDEHADERRQYFNQSQGRHSPMPQAGTYPALPWLQYVYVSSENPNNCFFRLVPYPIQTEQLNKENEKTKTSAQKKSNELVKPEVLLAMKQAEVVVEDKGTNNQDEKPSTSCIKIDDKSLSKKTSRKRKIKNRCKDNVQGERNPSPDAKKKCIKTNTSSKLQSDKADPQKTDSSSHRLTQKGYDYKNAKYIRFRNTDQKKIHKKKSKK